MRHQDGYASKEIHRAAGARATLRADRGCSIHAFTLVELLVVIAVIGMLIGILLPVLGHAKNRAKDLACLANHRQFGIAFAAYVADAGQFPITEHESPHSNRLSWAGVDWYSDDDFFVPLLDNRPLNPYFGLKKHHEDGFDLFRCPRDDGARHAASGEQVDWWELYAAQSNAPDAYESVYGVFGTSYAANEWMWVHPQSEDGFGLYPWPYYKRDMGPDDVLITASRFVLVTDVGADWAGRLSHRQRISANAAQAWWHGYEMGQMTFLDGSARRHEMGKMLKDSYCYWSNPDVQWRAGHRP